MKVDYLQSKNTYPQGVLIDMGKYLAEVNISQIELLMSK